MIQEIYQWLAMPWKWVALQGVEKFHLNHLIVRCAGLDCPRHQSPQLALLARKSGIHFRNRWYHQVSCLQRELHEQVEQLLFSFGIGRDRPHRLPLGLLLVKHGAITAEQLREALRRQREGRHGKLGHWLRQFVELEDAQLTAALGQQWGCPVFPLDRQAHSALLVEGLPLPVLLGCRAVPVHADAAGRQLHIAFADGVDHTLLYAVEQVLGIQTHACVSGEQSVNRVLEELSRQVNGNEICFDTVRGPSEIAATICNYSRELNANHLKVVRAGSYLWAAIVANHIRRDLLFRMQVKPTESKDEKPQERSKAFISAADIRKDGVLEPIVPLPLNYSDHGTANTHSIKPVE